MNLICSFLTFKALTGGLRRIWFRGKETLRSVDQFSKKKKQRSCSVNVLGGLGSVLINHSAPRAFPQPLRGSRFVDSLCLIVLMRPRFFSSSISLIFFFVLLLLQAFIYVIQGHSIFLKQAINNLNIGATLKGCSRIRLWGAYYGTNNFVIKESIAGTS